MRWFLTIFLFFISNIAEAADVDRSFFKDWASVSALLDSKNVDTSDLDWPTIEQMCHGLKKDVDETAYNQCLYEKAMDEHQWKIDHKYCDERSKKKYHDDGAEVRTYTVLDVITGRRVIHRDVDPYGYHRNSRSERKQAYEDCMHDANWNDVDDWQAGRRDQPVSKRRKSRY